MFCGYSGEVTIKSTHKLSCHVAILMTFSGRLKGQGPLQLVNFNVEKVAVLTMTWSYVRTAIIMIVF